MYSLVLMGTIAVFQKTMQWDVINLDCSPKSFLGFFLFLFFGHVTWLVGILVSQPGREPDPHQ